MGRGRLLWLRLQRRGLVWPLGEVQSQEEKQKLGRVHGTPCRFRYWQHHGDGGFPIIEESNENNQEKTGGVRQDMRQ